MKTSVRSAAAVSNTKRQVCTFMLGDLLFGVDVTSVNEVIRAQPMTRVPLAPAFVRGLINLRGQIVTAIDMRERLQLPLRDAANEPMNIVVNDGDTTVSLLVDEIGDVLHLEEKDSERVPENLDPTVKALVEAVYKLDGRLLLLFDAKRIDAIVSVTEQAQHPYA